MMGLLGMLLAIALLIFFAYKGYHLFPLTILVSLVVLITSGVTLWEGITDGYLAYFSNFIQNNGLVLLAGALFGQVMSDSGCAKSVATKLINVTGLKHILLMSILVTSLFAYAGLATFVIIFTVYPITKGLYEEAKLPQTLNAAALALGFGTYTMTSLPYSPAVQNTIPTKILGTDIAAAPLMGIVCAAILFCGGYAYLRFYRYRKILACTPEAVEAINREGNLNLSSAGLPDWKVSIVPIALVIASVVITKGRMAATAGVVLSLSIGILACAFIGIKFNQAGLKKTLAEGSLNGSNAIIAAAAVVGFGGVVQIIPVFQDILDWLLALNCSPYLKEAISVNVISGIVGSATGGVTIFMDMLGQTFLNMGLNPEAIHRVATVASGGLDSLPHCSTVVIIFSYMGLTHKEAYRDFGVVTVLIPLAATVVAVLMATFMY